MDEPDAELDFPNESSHASAAGDNERPFCWLSSGKGCNGLSGDSSGALPKFLIYVRFQQLQISQLGRFADWQANPADYQSLRLSVGFTALDFASRLRLLDPNQYPEGLLI
ncbi:MAG: hypothetical protein WC100_02290 [Sterolibacterium sp.]